VDSALDVRLDAADWLFSADAGQAPLEQIQLALGHQNIQTTQRYLGSELDLTDAACDRLGSGCRSTRTTRLRDG
jgi:hypothetical protein